MASSIRRKRSRQTSRSSVNPRMISRQRADCVDKIERMRSMNGASSKFVEKAHCMLLPRYWAKASWKTRAETLEAVEWFLRMGEAAHHDNRSGDNWQGISSVDTSDALCRAHALHDVKLQGH